MNCASKCSGTYYCGRTSPVPPRLHQHTATTMLVCSHLKVNAIIFVLIKLCFYLFFFFTCSFSDGCSGDNCASECYGEHCGSKSPVLLTYFNKQPPRAHVCVLSPPSHINYFLFLMMNFFLIIYVLSLFFYHPVLHHSLEGCSGVNCASKCSGKFCGGKSPVTPPPTSTHSYHYGLPARISVILLLI